MTALHHLVPRAAALALLCIALGCARTDGAASGSTKQTGATAASSTVAASSGEVGATSASMTSGLTDSVSAKADRGRIRGSESATVWLVEISDFQCPYCKQWHEASFAAIDRDYVKTGKVRLAYLNMPLEMHRNARAASEAAMCASVQGKFWELHESLFTTQAKWEELPSPMAVFDSLARVAGVDAKAWQSCMTTHATAAIIDADRERSRTAGIRSTPTFFVGSQKIEGAYPVDTFRVVLDREIAKARGGK